MKGKILMADTTGVSPYTEEAKVLVGQIRAIREQVPRFTPEVPGEARSMGAKAALSEQFLEAASVSIQKSPALEAISGTRPEVLRDAAAFALAQQAALTEAEALVRAIAHTIRVAKAAAGQSALDIYAIAQRVAKRKDGAELVPHVKDMRRKLNLGRRKATSEPAPDPSLKTAPKA
jgi:hypothetical protein